MGEDMVLACGSANCPPRRFPRARPVRAMPADRAKPPNTVAAMAFVSDFRDFWFFFLGYQIVAGFLLTVIGLGNQS
jgi:hypothetical protein